MLTLRIGIPVTIRLGAVDEKGNPCPMPRLPVPPSWMVGPATESGGDATITAAPDGLSAVFLGTDIGEVSVIVSSGGLSGMSTVMVIAGPPAAFVLNFEQQIVDLGIEFGATDPLTKGKNDMANKQATGPAIKCPCLCPKTGGMKAVMPDVVLTNPLPASITLQPLDASGAGVPLTPADNVTGTLVSDNAALTIAAGADATHYVGTIPANTPSGSVANLAATLRGTIKGAAADLAASVKVTINLPPAPTAVDLAIIFA
jgi:hypothetical protein